MAEEEKSVEGPTRSEFPPGRIKKIMKLDKDINKITSEALSLVVCSTDLFLRFLAENSAEVATEKKRKFVKLEHIRIAVKRHQPTSDFLLDSLPVPTQSSDKPASDKSRAISVTDTTVPAGTRRIDHFFAKSVNGAPIQSDDS
ncbi:hypothetical protein K2173_003306 [Erythroxylum novogranatense]|uniref:Transcription factor CBF/NF-Y/archaeal histone domain-containing protein n=1 Tax=Erythroxylum novogranatense TaxID=1862640 RepID=A0AAV8SYI7_9ROSI|nr:hypothetical protein K2173_003306 [Erythroxylum novogranatense]